jgi:site-specific DNA-cytosine methylase
MYDFMTVNGLAGAFDLGAVQAGGRLIHRAGSLSLGAPLLAGNRPLLGWDWEQEFTKDYREWERPSAPVLIGSPPCSAWSTLTRKDLRGGDAKIMSCTQELIDYACIQQTAPYIIAIESVQQAFSTGRKWYQAAREQLEAQTGHKYDLVWVMQSNASLGGASVRKRVFVVYARVPFGVEYAQPRRVPRLGDALRDLEGLEMTFEKQPYRRPATWWSIQKRSDDGVDGHTAPKKLLDQYTNLYNLLKWSGEPWRPGETTGGVLKRYYQKYGHLPQEWAKGLDKLLAKDFDLGLNQTVMWNPDKLGPVVTGRGPHHSVHWTEARTLTYRECARLQGFPDTWRIWPARDYKHLSAAWGKGVPVDCGRWVSGWIFKSLAGQRGTVQGSPIGNSERLLDITQAYKATINMERLWEHRKYEPHEHGHWLDYEHDDDGGCCEVDLEAASLR